MKTTKKKKLVPIPVLLKRAEKIFNNWVRARDSEDGFFKCISCSKVLPTESMNAGHFIPVGSSSFLRFHPDNVHGECQGCNCFDRSHLVGYTLNLIKKIGQERVDWLQENRRNEKRWNRVDLEEIIDKYK